MTSRILRFGLDASAVRGGGSRCILAPSRRIVARNLHTSLPRGSRQAQRGSILIRAFKLIAICSVVAIGGFKMLFEKYKIRTLFQLPKDCPGATIKTLSQATKKEADKDWVEARILYEKVLEMINSADPNGPSEKLLAARSNVSARLSNLYYMDSRLDQAKASMLAMLETPYGHDLLKCQALLALATDPGLSETVDEKKSYLKRILEYTLSSQAREKMTSNTRCDLIVPANTIVPSIACESLISLAVLSVKEHNLQDALNILLGALRGLRYTKQERQETANTRDETIACQEGVIMLYISEILWALNHRPEAVAWAKSSFLESYPLSREASKCFQCARTGARNLAHMLDTMGQVQVSEKYRTLERMCEKPVKSPTGFSYTWES